MLQRQSTVAISLTNLRKLRRKGGLRPPPPWGRSEPHARDARMSKPPRDSSSGAGLDVVVILPAPVVEQIEARREGKPGPSSRRMEG